MSLTTPDASIGAHPAALAPIVALAPGTGGAAWPVDVAAGGFASVLAVRVLVEEEILARRIRAPERRAARLTVRVRERRRATPSARSAVRDVRRRVDASVGTTRQGDRARGAAARPWRTVARVAVGATAVCGPSATTVPTAARVGAVTGGKHGGGIERRLIDPDDPRARRAQVDATSEQRGQRELLVRRRHGFEKSKPPA